MRKIAVFDVDGTIFRSSLVVELVNGFVERGIFPHIAEKELNKDYIAWLNRTGSFENYIKKVVDIFKKHIGGSEEKLTKKTLKEIVKSQKDHTYVFTRELIKRLKKENYFLIAISGSPVFSVEEFAKKWGFDRYFGSVYEVKKGKFTGKILNDPAWLKHEVLSNFLKENKKFGLKGSVGVGDSEIDISFLKLVDNPIAFNPDIKLAKYAKANKWRIIIERKNVIYELSDYKIKPTS
jgi:HAD superfamily hydrolase (TIGR01490 family)